jgi:thioredoxin-related protein
MKKIMMMLMLAGFALATRAEVNWSEDFPSASKAAAEQNKYMLLNFTGSDWCGWCIKLDNEVFSQDEFREYAEENFVLVKLDFPRKKQLSPGVVQQNHKLQEQYGVRGYPTILLLAPDGSLVQQTGYQPGGPAAYVEHLKGIIAGHKK